MVVDVRISGRFVINFTMEDLYKLGIKSKGTEFEIQVYTDGRQFSTLVTLDEYPFVCSNKGDWLVFTEPEQGQLVVGLHNVQGNIYILIITRTTIITKLGVYYNSIYIYIYIYNNPDGLDNP